MTLKHAVSLALIFACALTPACSSRVEEATATSKKVAPAAAPFPYPVIELAGDGALLGAGHGQHLGETIRGLHDRYFARYFRSNVQRLLALTAADAFASHLLPEHRSEVRALAASSNVEARQMMLAQCFLDLSAMTACSTVTLPADAAPDGVARFGRNLDFPSFDVADKATVVLVYRPAGRYGFVSVGWPGLIGVLSGMNEHGLSVANMEVSRSMRLPDAMPYTLLYRAVLEQCRTTDEAIAFIEKTPRQSANNLMVMDAAGDRALIEITPQKVTARRGEPGRALLSTNHQRGAADHDTAGRCHRYDTMHDRAAADFGKVDAENLRATLDAASAGDMTLQSMIFEPANRVILLSAGKDAAAGTFHRFELSKYFAPAGPQVASN